jgi:L-histidine Nalpha-methyltransferase
MAQSSSIAEIVRRGLTAREKSLPPFLLYDARGSELFEEITALPEYYPTRTERSIFEREADAIVAEAAGLAADRLAVLELGAGSATKTQVLLRALVRRQGVTLFIPADVCSSVLEAAAARLRREEPGLHVQPLAATHAEALARGRTWDGTLLVMFIGSSIGNYDDVEAVRLLADVRSTLGPRGVLLLGTDLVKPLDVLLPAYDDASGVTAAFNLNVLSRINRELGGRFDLSRFRHVAEWNEAASCVELHLESVVEQTVPIDALGLRIDFRAGERIHTESSHKYDAARVDALLSRAGLTRARSFVDARRWFAVHLARAAGRTRATASPG